LGNAAEPKKAAKRDIAADPGTGRNSGRDRKMMEKAIP
jgi:hypothetical protein